jgi:hypothetical protein
MSSYKDGQHKRQPAAGTSNLLPKWPEMGVLSPSNSTEKCPDPDQIGADFDRDEPCSATVSIAHYVRDSG